MSTVEKQRWPSTDPLTSEERELWFAWKRAHEVVRTRIADDVTAATGLSDPDVAILIRLDESGGTLRQNRLAAWLGWDRTRLSHQLTRMESRGLLTRRKLVNGVDINLTTEGRAAVARARPVHAKAVRQHLLDPISGTTNASFLETLVRLADHSDRTNGSHGLTPRAQAVTAAQAGAVQP